MFIVTPEFTRAVHDERRRRLLADGEARRVRREVAAARRAERPARRPSGRLRALIHGRRHHDAKIARLAESWLELDDRAARLLAQVADEVAVPAGETLVPGRFSYIGLDGAPRGLMVTAGTPPLAVESAASVLVLTTGDLEAIMPTVPILAVSHMLATSDTPASAARAADDTHDTVEPDPFGLATDIHVGDRPRRRIVRRLTVFAPASDIVGDDRAVAEFATRG